MKIKIIKAKTGGLFLVNPYVSGILKKHYRILENMAKMLPKCGIIAPVFLTPKGKIYFHGSYVTPRTQIPMPYAQGEEDINQYPTERAVECSPLYFAYLTPKVVKNFRLRPKLGADPFIDADLALEIAQKGLKVYVTPKVKVIYTLAYRDKKARTAGESTFKTSYLWFQAKNQKILNARYRMPVSFQTACAWPTGYARHAKFLIKALVEAGIDVKYNYIGGTNEAEPHTNDAVIDDLREDMGNFHMPQVVLSVGTTGIKNSGDYKILFTTTEVDGLPDSWVKVMNMMDEVWTNSRFCRDVFIKSGVKVPVYNLSMGVDVNYFHPYIKPLDIKTSGNFLFVSNFAWGKRKGKDVLFRAFKDEFDKDEKVSLLIKASQSFEGENIKAGIKKMYHRKGSAPINVIEAALSDAQVAQLYTAAQAFVLPTRGEGFGMPLLEALSCGLPVITTAYSGQLDYLLRGLNPTPGAHLTEFDIVPYDGGDSCYYEDKNWAEPRVDDLRKKMRYVFENYNKCKNEAWEGMRYVHKNFSWEVAAKKVISRLKHIYSKKAQWSREKA